MLPVVGVPETIRRGLRPYRDLFRRAEGFEHVSRYVTGLIVSPNKTLQGIYAQHVWEESFDPFSNVIDVYVKRLRDKLDTGFGRRLTPACSCRRHPCR